MASGAVKRDVVAQVNYITYNLAGADDGFGDRGPWQRIEAAKHLIAYVDVVKPIAVAVQELCDNTDDKVNDAFEALNWEMTNRGYFPYSGRDLKTHGTCKQRNGVYAKGNLIEANYFPLPKVPGEENRDIVCLKMQAYVVATSCSFHLESNNPVSRLQQSQAALSITRVFGQNTYAWAGGDMNAQPTDGSVAPIWDQFFSEGDQWRNPPTATSRGIKLDYMWGMDPNTVALPGATFDVRNVWSDHNLYVGIYNWYR
jgi:hypothetical protein